MPTPHGGYAYGGDVCAWGYVRGDQASKRTVCGCDPSVSSRQRVSYASKAVATASCAARSALRAVPRR